MGLFTIFEIFSNFGQYLGIIGSINVTWPSALSWVGNYLHFLRIDFTQSINLPDIRLPSLDWRAQYIILTDVLPLGLAILLLVFFKSVRVVIWYCALLASIGILFAGLVLTFIQLGPFSSLQGLSQVLCIVGGCFLIVCFLGYFFYRILTSYRTRVHPKATDAEDAMSLTQESSSNEGIKGNSSEKIDVKAIQKKDRYSKKSFWIQTRNFTLGALLIVLGLLIADVYPSSTLQSIFHYYYLIEDTFSTVSATVGWIMVGFGIALLYNWMMGHFAIVGQIFIIVIPFPSIS